MSQKMGSLARIDNPDKEHRKVTSIDTRVYANQRGDGSRPSQSSCTGIALGGKNALVGRAMKAPL